MTSPSNQPDRPPRRHDLIFVSPAAWRRLLETRDDLATEPLVAGWADRGWPLVARRVMAGEGDGLPLGLPLPPFAGKRRIAVLIRGDDVLSVKPAPGLETAIDVAPDAWRRTLEAVFASAIRYSVSPRVFGSLAWRLLTGLDYLSQGSDLDLLLPLDRGTDIARLTASLAAIESTAPMRLDGELMRDDGAGVNWRELHAGAREVLVKTSRGVALCPADDFLSGGALS